MVKQNASLDASFWINACAGGIVEFLPSYFFIVAAGVVAEEIRYPLEHLGIEAFSVVQFDEWIDKGLILLRKPQSPVDWFQEGENAAIALAREHNYWLLIDDANPYHRAKSVGLSVVGTADFTILLFDHRKISYETAHAAIRTMRMSKRQRRTALFVLETLARRKGDS